MKVLKYLLCFASHRLGGGCEITKSTYCTFKARTNCALQKRFLGECDVFFNAANLELCAPSFKPASGFLIEALSSAPLGLI